MTNVEIIHAVYARIENRPGTLQTVAQALGASRINIDALSLETNGGQGFARIITPKWKEAVEQLRRANVDAHETRLVLVTLPNKPGELARATSELAAAGLNVEAVLTTPQGRLAFRTNDVDLAAKVLGKL